MITLTSAPAVAEWVAKRVGLPSAASFGSFTCVGVGLNGSPAMGVVYSQLQEHAHGNDIFATIAAETGRPWAKPAVLKYIFSYPFNELGCGRITCLIREGNERSVNLAKRMGFRKEGVIRRGWDGKTNALVFGILKEECRYIRNG